MVERVTLTLPITLGAVDLTKDNTLRVYKLQILVVMALGSGPCNTGYVPSMRDVF